MPVAEWTSSFATGNEIVDCQHQELFALVNRLHDGIVAGQGKNVLAASLEELAAYTVQHFAAEERLMREAAYPGAAEHQAEHRKLTQKATRIIADYRAGRFVLSVTLSLFLAEWLNHHIRQVDKRMAQYLQGHRGIAA